MEFSIWLENEELIKKIEALATEIYGKPPDPKFMQQLHPEELEKYLKWLDTDERARLEINKQIQQRELEKKQLALQTEDDIYYRAEPGDIYERIICSDTDPKADKIGMQLFPLSHLGDPELQKLYGVYVGSPDEWLQWMVDDGYCDGDIAYVYNITIPANPPFYITRDPNSGGFAGEYASREVPEAEILFSTVQSIPAQYIELVDAIENPQGFGYEDEDEDDEEYY